MLLYFYKMTDPPNKLSKTVSNPLSLNGYCRDEVDQYEPEILVESDITDYNYMYIPAWYKYYFINGCEVVRTGEYRVKDTHIDVLNTYKTDILTQRVILDKTENSTLAKPYLNDGSYVISQKMQQFKHDFNGSAFGGYEGQSGQITPQYVLVTSGNKDEAQYYPT